MHPTARRATLSAKAETADLRVVSLLRDEAAEPAARACAALGLAPVDMAEPQEPEGCILFVDDLAQNCDLLMLPLSFEKAVSLHIARQVHQQRVPVRTLLVTASPTATRQSTVPLFDDMVRLGSPDLRSRILYGATTPTPPRLTIDAVERQISRLIQVENCFARERLPSDLQTTLAEVVARDGRFLAAYAELAQQRGVPNFTGA